MTDVLRISVTRSDGKLDGGLSGLTLPLLDYHDGLLSTGLVNCAMVEM